MTEADGSGEGDCPAVEKFDATGLLLGNGLLSGTGASWGRVVVTLAGAAAAAAVRSSVYPDVCSHIRVRPGTRITPEICRSLNGVGEVTAQAAVARGCADGGSGLIASAGSGSRRLRQTQCDCHNAHHNQSKFNRCNLSHIIFPPSHVVLGLSDVSFIPKSSARADPARLRTRRIFQCYRRGDRCSLVRDRMERV